MEKNTKIKNFHILQVNCDCSSFLEARKRIETKRWMRCRLCGKQLGDMEYNELAIVKAEHPEEAIKKYREEK